MDDAYYFEYIVFHTFLHRAWWLERKRALFMDIQDITNMLASALE